MQFPGAEIIPDARRGSTMATTIDAPPSAVWPWLLQMGFHRGGWYSWDHLDNWGASSADRLHPEWQEVSVGDRLATTPSGNTWFEVAALEPESFFALRAPLMFAVTRTTSAPGGRGSTPTLSGLSRCASCLKTALA